MQTTDLFADGGQRPVDGGHDPLLPATVTHSGPRFLRPVEVVAEQTPVRTRETGGWDDRHRILPFEIWTIAGADCQRLAIALGYDAITDVVVIATGPTVDNDLAKLIKRPFAGPTERPDTTANADRPFLTVQDDPAAVQSPSRQAQHHESEERWRFWPRRLCGGRLSSRRPGRGDQRPVQESQPG